MTTVLDLKGKILRLLSEESNGLSPLGGTQTTSDMLLDGINAALDAITARAWKASTYTIAEVCSSHTMPTDMIDIEAVYEATRGILLPRVSMRAGDFFNDPNGNAWISYPAGSISFMNDLDASGVTVYYSASWPVVTSDTDTLTCPSYCITPLSLYAASHCLVNMAVAAGVIGQYKTKVDSGQPVDNPLLDLSTFLLRRFEYTLQQIPPMQKGSY